MTEKKFKTAIVDNNERGSVGEFLTQRINPDAELSFVSAYFTIYAYQHLKDKLDSIKRLDFLFGEPTFLKSLDPEKTDKKSFKIEDDGLKIANRLEQKKAAKECAEWIKAKVDIRSMVKPSFLHGKLYHIKNTNEVEHAVVGSSNFTVSGLGLGSNPNIELNLLINDKRDLDDLREWFLEVWNNTEIVEDVKDEVLAYLAKLYLDNSPEFIYYKTLYHIFEKYLGEQEISKTLLGERHQLTETKIWKTLFEFQKDGVKGSINKILSHNGCIIADSVGLGKTFEALAIIKYFEVLNHKVLVLCPKKLKDNWTIYQAQNNSELNLFVNDRFSYTVLCHTDLSREGGYSGDINLSTINWGNYDLVVIDESHNFRNNTKGKRDEDGNIVKKSRYERLMDDIIKSGVKTKVLLLSATPVNINLKDLRNQIFFITEDKDDAFNKSMKILSIANTLQVAQKNFTDWAKQKNPQKRNVRNLLERLPSGFFKLLDELTIARSRKHIQRYYSQEIERIGAFPERLKPIAVFPKIDILGEFMSYDKLNDEISNYQLSLFLPSKYIKDEYKAEYEEKARIKGIAQFTQMDREYYLTGMMKINFMKRLESSIRSFEITMGRTIQKIQELENRLVEFKKGQTAKADIDYDELNVNDVEDDELHEALEVGKKLNYKLAHLKLDDWLVDLKKDKDQLTVLYKAAQKITDERDAKLLELKLHIEHKLMKPSVTKDGKPNRKVLIFTAFADTVEYLYGVISKWASDGYKVHTAVVSGGTGSNKTTFEPKGYKGQTEFNHILTNFSPISKNRSKISSMPQEGEIDILIATDCISEGQNLQDCDYLINYDIHWNPVRIIQRFGRIDRIGSINKTVQLVNFWATEDLNKYINLKNRVEARMALVDIAATTEDNILATDDLKELITEDLRYRDKQLIRLKDEVLDLEDFNESVSLSEFTLDDFRIELSKYIENNKQILKDAPLGLYTVVPSPSGENAHIGDYSKLDSLTKDIISKGVVFCLKQKGETDGTESVNPLQPYFLVFVRNDGTVRYTFTQAKQILEMYRILCSERKSPYEELCKLFDEQTDNGNKMHDYDNLLVKAIDAIISTFKKRTFTHLLTDRNAIIPEKKKQVRDTSDFELITWLVIY
jgi:SNF2 family DNA or RNA helicase